MSRLKAAMHLGAIAILGVLTTPALGKTVKVTNNGDDEPPGPGSFRAAVEAASLPGSDVTRIHFRYGLGTIAIGSPIVYSGEQSLTIDGQGAVIEPDADSPDPFDLFVADGGGDELTLKRLTFQSGLNGIVVQVPADAEGEVSVRLSEVTVADNHGYGLHIEDQDDEDPPGGSGAGIALDISNSVFSGNGKTLPDPAPDDLPLDGARVDEAGDGDVTATIHNSEFTSTGADGLELNETGPGDVTLIVRRSTLDGNGLIDPDDGVDIDEEDEGSVSFRIVQSTFNNNSDDGIDMDEDGEGDMRASLVQVEVLDNDDKGVNLGENGPGDLEARVNVVFVEGNGFVSSGADAGLRMREADEGDFFAQVVQSTVADNDLDIEVAEDGDGDGTLRLQNVKYVTSDFDGVTVIEVP